MTSPWAARRRIAAGLVALLPGAFTARPAGPFAAHGRIEPPQPVPDLSLLRDDGGRTTLARQLGGRITAVHFMFTACTSVCPILGATFGQVQERLQANRSARLQLLSLSVDALGETPSTLQAWRRRMGAVERWRAAVPRPADADRMTRWAAGPVPFSFDVHSSQVLLFDGAARLVFRSAELPQAEQIVRLMGELDAARMA